MEMCNYDVHMKQLSNISETRVFSFSQIKMYQACPYQYKLGHVLKLPTQGKHYFSFGTSGHNTLQKFYQRIQELNAMKQNSLFGALLEKRSIASNIKVPLIEELFALYDACFISEWYQTTRQRDDYYKKGKEILEIFYASQNGKWTIPVNLESSFKISIGDVLLRGRIDRIDQLPDGTLEIIDYKTGYVKETLTTEDKEQLLLYQIAAEALPEYRHVGKISKLTFYYLNDNIQTSFVGENEDLERLRRSIMKAADGIRLGSFEATPSSLVCKYCDFKEMCEYRAQ